MSEPIAVRVKRIVAGNLNGLVDSLEASNAESVMRESIREVERASDDVRQELGQVLAASMQNQRMIDRTNVKRDELEAQAKLAVGQGRDDLAEAALGRIVDLEAELPKYEKAIADLAAKRAELDGYVAALDKRKREMEADLSAFLAEREAASSIADVAGVGASVATRAELHAERANRAFDRAMQGRAGTVLPGSDRDTQSKLGELERLQRKSKITDRLAALKSTG